MKNTLLIIIALFISTNAFSQNCENEKANNYWNQALNIEDNAQNISDFLLAIQEYEKVRQIIPNCPDIYYNIARLYEKLSSLAGWGYFDKAIDNYNKYVNLSNLSFADEEVYELINKIEKLNNGKINRLAGYWSCQLSQFPDIKFSFNTSVNPIITNLYGTYSSKLEVVDVKYDDTQIIINYIEHGKQKFNSTMTLYNIHDRKMSADIIRRLEHKQGYNFKTENTNVEYIKK